MAKKATSKPAPKAAKAAAVSAALPASNEPAQHAEQGMTAPLSPPAPRASVEMPPGVSGVSPPAATLSKVVVTDPAGDTYAEGDIPPEIVVGSEAMRAADEPPAEPETPQPAAKPSLADHPAIVAAQSYVTPHGKPDNAPPKYFTPPPHELRKKATS